MFGHSVLRNVVPHCTIVNIINQALCDRLVSVYTPSLFSSKSMMRLLSDLIISHINFPLENTQEYNVILYYHHWYTPQTEKKTMKFVPVRAHVKIIVPLDPIRVCINQTTVQLDRGDLLLTRGQPFNVYRTTEDVHFIILTYYIVYHSTT